MTRAPLTFKETDIVRAIRSAVKAGLHIAGFEITKAGSIIVHVDKANNDHAPDETEEEDTWADFA